MENFPSDSLSLDELNTVSSRQSHHLRMQRQNVLSKEERLKNLIAQYHRHEQKLDNLKHIRATLQAQESRLRDLKHLKQQVDQQAQVNNQLGDELEKSKSLFANRERDLAEAVAKVDILTAQLDRNRTNKLHHPTSATATEHPHSALIMAEIDRLKQEQRQRSHLVQQQKRKLDDKDASLLQKTLERTQLDMRIHEIAERLNKRKIQQSQGQQPMGTGGNGGGGKAQGVYGGTGMGRSAGGTMGMGGGGHVMGRDPAKVATVEPYSQRLSGDGGQNKIDGNLPSKYSDSNGQRNIERSSQASNGLDSDSSSGMTFGKSEISLKEVPPSPPTETNLTGKNQRRSGDSENLSDHQQQHREKTQQRIELILRETSNLPNLVTDTLLRENKSDYLRSAGNGDGTPDTCSSASESPSNSSAVPPAPIADPTPPKTHRPTSQQTDRQAPKDTGSSSGSSQVTAVVPAGTAGKSQRRVKFDPQALLLDASLEGELELVVKTVQQVVDPSASNDEGITALHNAICAGHFAIVKFLVEYGCDVNAQDTDGWSPLHCAASCNNLMMCRFLIEHGACVYATTHSDQESAAQKCEEDEADYEGCKQYLLDTLHQLGRINEGIVFAVYDYQAQNTDELSFQCGDKLKVLRLSDDDETEWYWAERLTGSATSNTTGSGNSGKTAAPCGYIPRNLLALYPRVRRSQRSN